MAKSAARYTVSFDCSADDARVISKIGGRASASLGLPKMDVEMDVTACHVNAFRLRLTDLLAADDFNFAHDIYGLRRHLNRDTGKLGDCFVPRFTLSAA